MSDFGGRLGDNHSYPYFGIPGSFRVELFLPVILAFRNFDQVVYSMTVMIDIFEFRDFGLG